MEYNKNEEMISNGTSVADELKKYKELLDMGIVTQEEFDVKKKQLLGLDEPSNAVTEEEQPIVGETEAVDDSPIPGSGLGVAGLIFGIASLAFLWAWYLAMPFAIVGLILSGKAESKARNAYRESGVATAGNICSKISFWLTFMYLVFDKFDLLSKFYEMMQ